jgi:hypothetical protein
MRKLASEFSEKAELKRSDCQLLPDTAVRKLRDRSARYGNRAPLSPLLHCVVQSLNRMEGMRTRLEKWSSGRYSRATTRASANCEPSTG